MSVNRQVVNSNQAPPPRPFYNQAVIANGFVFCSGQLPKDSTGKIVEGTVQDRAHQCIRNLKAVLESAGSSLAKIVEVNVFLADMEDFEKMNEVYLQWFGEIKPVRTYVPSVHVQDCRLINFTGFDCHAQGIINFIQTHFQEITSDALGRGAIATWVLARNHDWHSTLSQSELPFDSFAEFNLHESSHIRPLFFTSHRLAMNYAYYVSSRVLQCMSHPGATETEESSGDVEIAHWSTVLLRIVSGLYKQTCASKNVYSIGVSSLLVACVLRYHSLAFGRWVENWLLECHQLSIFEEGSFPIAQAWQVVRLVNEERAAGNMLVPSPYQKMMAGGLGSTHRILVSGLTKSCC